MPPLRGGRTPGLAVALLLAAANCAAQSLTEQTNEGFATATNNAAHVTDKAPRESGKPSFVVLPIPLSNPTVGTGVTLVGAALYDPNHSVRPWVTGVGAMATTNGSHALGAAQQASFMDDRLRVVGVFGRADLKLKFYGIGSSAGARQVAVPTEDRGTFTLLQGLYGVTNHLFLGVRFQDLRIKTSLDLSEVGAALGLTLQSLELDHRTTSIGPAIDFDTRDNQFAPSEGDYATLRIGFATPKLGSDVSYRNLRATWAHYFGLTPELVLAARGSACAVDGRVPFTELCLYGTSNDLRGYTGGQYRDRDMYAVQMEARWRFAPRWGAVLFAGTGAVAATFGELFSSHQLPAAGAGIRWLASTQYKVNVSTDVAFGRDSRAVYFSIGEAFSTLRAGRVTRSRAHAPSALRGQGVRQRLLPQGLRRYCFSCELVTAFHRWSMRHNDGLLLDFSPPTSLTTLIFRQAWSCHLNSETTVNSP
jgi:hypothetical protein